MGDTRTISVDCRIVAATNSDLLDEIDAGHFREDLYYRLNVIPIYLPALRQRPEDIAALAEFFATSYATANSLPLSKITDDALKAMRSYQWPGNVRELQNYVERAIVLSTSPTIDAELLPPHVRGLAPVRIGRHRVTDTESMCADLVTRGMVEAGDEAKNLHDQVVSMVERELILQVLKICQGVQTKAATRLGINRNTLHKKIEDYNLHDAVR